MCSVEAEITPFTMQSEDGIVLEGRLLFGGKALQGSNKLPGEVGLENKHRKKHKKVVRHLVGGIPATTTLESIPKTSAAAHLSQLSKCMQFELTMIAGFPPSIATCFPQINALPQ